MINRTSTTLIAVCSTWILIACSDPRDTEIPPLSRIDSIQSSIAKLTDEERQLLKAYIERQLLPLSAAQDRVRSLERITIRQAIGDQRDWQHSQAVALAELERRNADAKAAETNRLQALGNTVSLRLIERRLIDRPASEGPTSTSIPSLVELAFKIEILNNSIADLSGIDGSLNITDMFDNHLQFFSISEQVTLDRGKTHTIVLKTLLAKTVSGSIVAPPALLETPLEKFKIHWFPKRFVFADGKEIY